MTNEQKDNLFVLVKSLTKSEKRQFRLYVGRMGSNQDAKFLNLFQQLDRMSRYEEKIILSKGIVTKQQLILWINVINGDQIELTQTINNKIIYDEQNY